MKKYILYAGVNGAGKSTLYQTTKYKEQMLRINTDEILREFGDWRNISDVMAAGKIVVKRMKQYFADGVTLNQETTLCGKSAINSILKAKERGYIIELHYIGVDSVDIAKQRGCRKIKIYAVKLVQFTQKYSANVPNAVVFLCELHKPVKCKMDFATAPSFSF